MNQGFTFKLLKGMMTVFVGDFNINQNNFNKAMESCIKRKVNTELTLLLTNICGKCKK